MKGYLILEDGFLLEGEIFGNKASAIGEAVFNTSLTGYQEILTDPSYCGQMVVMTYPLIGNYGVNSQDVESSRVWCNAFIVKELSKIYSNWRAEKDLDSYLKENNVVGISGIDTRALTRHIRRQGAMQGAVVPEDEMDSVDAWVKRIKGSQHLEGLNLAKEVSCSNAYDLDGESKNYRVAVIDCGVKQSILFLLLKEVNAVRVFPWNASPKEILAYKPDAVLFSNGPGDPSAVEETIETAKALLGRLPVWGICLGHQILGIAMGGKTYKLKFGHHGGNHPVKDLRTGRIDITAQNHGFCVDEESLKQAQIVMTHKNLYDNTLEGLFSKKYNVCAVQFHPEAGPGPFDAQYIFKNFLETINA